MGTSFMATTLAHMNQVFCVVKSTHIINSKDFRMFCATNLESFFFFSERHLTFLILTISELPQL